VSTIYDLAHDWLTYSDLSALSKSSSVDIVYERFAPFHKRASDLARSLAAPHIVEIHGPSSDRWQFGPAYFDKTADKIQESVVRRADAVRVVSQAVKAYYQKRGIPALKMHVLPNAVDPGTFDPRLVCSDVRSRFGLEDKIVVGFVGSMYAYHGLSVLTRASSIVSSKSSAIHFLIVGPLSNHLTRAVATEGLTNLFTLTGVVPYARIPEHIMAMDICVIPDSNWYGSPIKLFEYGAMAKPVVAPHLGPIEDVVEDRQSALLFPPGDVDGLARSVLQLAVDEGLRRALGSNWMAEVRAKHTWARRAQQVLEICESAN